MRPARAIVTFALVLASTGRAQDPPVDDTPRRTVPEATVVASRLPDPDPSATVRVITREEIQGSPARGLPELLQSLPGVDVRRRAIDGVQADIGLRGADHNGTLILVDGEPVNDPQSNHLSADLDVPLDAIERIEVYSGAASAVYGSQAVGGVVNIVTRGARLGRAQAQSESRLSHGTDSIDRGGIRAALKITERISAAVDWARAEWSGFAPDTESATTQVRAAGRWESPLGPVEVSGGYAIRRFGAYAFYGTAAPDQFETTRTQTVRAAATLSLGAWTVVPSFAIRAHHDEYLLDRDEPDLFRNVSDTTRVEGRLTARRPLLGGWIAAGAEAGDTSIRSTRIGDHNRPAQALFVEYGHGLGGPPEANGFRLALRADHIQGFGWHVSPRAGLFAAPFDGLRLRASAGTAFRLPTFTELYYSDPQNLGNPALSAQTSISVEAGATLDIGPVSLDGVFFHRHGTDLVDYVRSSASEPYQARNIRVADVSGVEASLGWRNGRLRAPAALWAAALTRLAVQATYNFVDLAALSAEAGGTEGKYVLNPLHVKWDFIAEGRLPLELHATARVSYFSRPAFPQAVWLWNARLGRDLLQGNILEVYVEGENLGNVRYEEVSGVPLPRLILVAGFHLTW